MFKRICIAWLVLMSLLWIVAQFVRVSGRCVLCNQTVCFAFDHGGLWFMHGPNYGAATLEVDTNGFLTNAATLAPPILGWNMLYQWGVIPYWLAAVPAALGLWWRNHKRIRRPPRGFAVQPAE